MGGPPKGTQRAPPSFSLILLTCAQHQPPRLPSSFPPAFVCPCAFMPALCWRSGPGCKNHSAHAQNRKCPETYPPPQGPAVQRYQHPSSLVADWDNSEGVPGLPMGLGQSHPLCNFARCQAGLASSSLLPRPTSSFSAVLFSPDNILINHFHTILPSACGRGVLPRPSEGRCLGEVSHCGTAFPEPMCAPPGWPLSSRRGRGGGGGRGLPAFAPSAALEWRCSLSFLLP